jgi:glutamyl-tRNA synthetase
MEITLVVRGVEYLSSTPKYDLLYRTFGWEIPIYVHLPHIIKESGKKLSKRDGDASFQDLLAQGFLPEAIVNYIALLGWNPGDEREFFTMYGLIAEFDVHRINKTSASFSFAKLEWLNSLHIRALSPETFHKMALAYYSSELVERLNTVRISALIQSRCIRLTDIPQMVGFFEQVADYSLDLFVHDKSKSTLSSSALVLAQLYPLLANVRDWTDESLLQRVFAFAAEAKLKNGTVMWPLRIALSGQPFTPGGAIEIAQILGKEETLRRLELAMRRLQPEQTSI